MGGVLYSWVRLVAGGVRCGVRAGHREEKREAEGGGEAVQVDYGDTTQKLARKKKSIPILGFAAGLSGERVSNCVATTILGRFESAFSD